MNPLLRAKIVSVGAYAPETVISNKDFGAFFETSEEWIEERTGIRERRYADCKENSTSSRLGAKAAAIALNRAGIGPEEVDGIICGTMTPDSIIPSTACLMQAALGCRNAFAFDLLAACAGFVFALATAESYIRSGAAKTMLVVGAEVNSRVLDWADRSSCILFGDGAGAVVLQGTCDGEERGILSTSLASDGRYADILTLGTWGNDPVLRMKGSEVFRHAVRLMSEVTAQTMKKAEWSADSIDLFIPHQANIRIIDSVAEKLTIPKAKIVTNLERYGNTSSASVPLALDEAWNSGRVEEDTCAVMTSVGGGLSAASAAVRF